MAQTCPSWFRLRLLAATALLSLACAPDGAPRSLRTVPTSTAEQLVGLETRDGTFALGALAKTPINQPGKAFEAELFFASGRFDRPTSEDVSRTISLDNDDVPASLTACGPGLYCFAGHTGFVD
jgi:hypothetical protein